LTRDNLAKRRKVDDPNCLFCLEPEYIQHLFIDCVVVKQCWKVISGIVGTNIGVNLAITRQFWLSDKRHGILNIVTSSAVFGVSRNS